MLARLIDVFSFGIEMPLLWYLILFVAISVWIVWYGFIYKEQGKELKQTQDALDDAYEELDAQDEEIEEMSHGYSTMALMLEDHHQMIVDLQCNADSQDRRMDILSDRLTSQREMLEYQQLTLSQVPWSQENADGIDEEEEPVKPLPEWIEGIGGLDSL